MRGFFFVYGNKTLPQNMKGDFIVLSYIFFNEYNDGWFCINAEL